MRNDGAMVEETHVLAAKLDRAGLGPGGRHGVLARAQQKEESDHEKIGKSCVPWRVLAQIMVGNAPDGACREGQLGLRSGVIAFVGLQEP